MRALPKLEYRPGGMRCVADTPHKTFNRQADYIGTGNVFSNVQTSSFVRAHNDTECNGFDFGPGYLRSFDLKPFGELPKHFREAVLRETQDKSVILYQFHHHGGNRRRIVHGYLITDPKTHDMLDFAITGPNWKSTHVLKWCAKYVSFPYREGEEPPAG